MRTLHRILIAAVVAAMCAALPRVAAAAADWRSKAYCPQPAASSSSIPLDTRLGTMAESGPCIIPGTLLILR